MRARYAFLILAIVGFVLGFTLWSGKRSTRAQPTRLAPSGSALQREVAEFEEPEVGVRAAARVELEDIGDAHSVAGIVMPVPGEAAIDVEVVAEETGEPIVGLWLSLAPEEPGATGSTDPNLRFGSSTDERGRAVFLVPADRSYLLRSSQGGGAESSRRIVHAPPAGERVALRLELRTRPEQVFFGRVVDAETGRPLAEATASFDKSRVGQTGIDSNRFLQFAIPSLLPGTIGGGAEGETRTDLNGLFWLAIPSIAPSNVRVEKKGYAWTVVGCDAVHGTPENAAVIRLARSARLVARIERLHGPVAGLELRVHAEGFWMKQNRARFWGAPTRDPQWRAAADASGVGVVEGLPPNVPLTIDVFEVGKHIERLPGELKLGYGEERGLVIRLGAGCRVAGTAFDADGTPVEGIQIWLLSTTRPAIWKEGRYMSSYQSKDVAERTRVDASGRFVFDDVAPANWVVGPAPEHRSNPEGVAALARAIEIAEGDLSKNVTLEFHRGLTIRGRVVGPDGEAVSSVFISGMRGVFQINSPDGNFVLGPLVPGEIELTAMAGARKEFARSAPVVAQAGDQDVVIRLRRGGAIRVVVRGPGGEPATADVILYPGQIEGATFMSMSTSPTTEGCYVFSGLLPGVYHLKATDALGNVGYLPELFVMEDANPQEHELTIFAGSRVLARVTGQPDSVHCYLRITQGGIPSGFGNLNAPVVVAPGPATILLQAYDTQAEKMIVLERREVTAIEGEQIEVVFDGAEWR